MQKKRPRDNRGRFSKSKNPSQSSYSSAMNNMSGEKRPRQSENKANGEPSPTISPLRKKSLAEETASWRSSPDPTLHLDLHFSNQNQPQAQNSPRDLENTIDFYPQYMRQNQSPALKSPQKYVSSSSHRQSPAPGMSSGTGGHTYQDKSIRTSASSSCSHEKEMVQPSQSLESGSDYTNPTDSHHNRQESPSTEDDNQMVPLHSQGATGHNQVIVLSNSNGLPINTLDLEDVMSRVMSKVMGKLDSLTDDIKQVPAIKATTAKLNKEMVQVRQDCHGIKDSVRELSQKEEENSSKHDALAKEVRDLKSKMDMGGISNVTKNPPKIQHSEIDQLKSEADSRRCNLIIEGIQEQEGATVTEEITEKQIKSFFTETLNLPKFEIASAFRLGKPRQGSSRPRPIKVRFLRPIEREWVWRAKALLAENRDRTHNIKEDLPPKLRSQMSALIRVSQIARKYPDLYQNVWIQDFKICINGSVYTADQLESLPAKLRPSVSSTPGNIYVVVFYGRDSKFSNHYQCSFTWDNKDFSSIEQYLAFRRACIAGRKDLANQAMRSRDPADSKRIMHTLKSSTTEPKWVEQRKDILFSGLMAKFSQNDYLMKYLLKSEKRKLGEASTDYTWGIGMSLLDNSVLDPTKWVGENLLGTTLMEVREELASWAKQDSTPSLDHHLSKESSGSSDGNQPIIKPGSSTK